MNNNSQQENFLMCHIKNWRFMCLQMTLIESALHAKIRQQMHKFTYDFQESIDIDKLFDLSSIRYDNDTPKSFCTKIMKKITNFYSVNVLKFVDKLFSLFSDPQALKDFFGPHAANMFILVKELIRPVILKLKYQMVRKLVKLLCSDNLPPIHVTFTLRESGIQASRNLKNPLHSYIQLLGLISHGDFVQFKEISYNYNQKLRYPDTRLKDLNKFVEVVVNHYEGRMNNLSQYLSKCMDYRPQLPDHILQYPEDHDKAITNLYNAKKHCDKNIRIIVQIMPIVPVDIFRIHQEILQKQFLELWEFHNSLICSRAEHIIMMNIEKLVELVELFNEKIKIVHIRYDTRAFFLMAKFKASAQPHMVNRMKIRTKNIIKNLSHFVGDLQYKTIHRLPHLLEVFEEHCLFVKIFRHEYSKMVSDLYCYIRQWNVKRLEMYHCNFNGITEELQKNIEFLKASNKEIEKFEILKKAISDQLVKCHSMSLKFSTSFPYESEIWHKRFSLIEEYLKNLFKVQQYWLNMPTFISEHIKIQNQCAPSVMVEMRNLNSYFHQATAFLESVESKKICKPHTDFVATLCFANSILKLEIPKSCLEISYSPENLLAFHTKDLVLKINYFQKWVAQGHPSNVWLSAFYNIHSYLVTLLLQHSQTEMLHVSEIDESEINSSERPPNNGACVHGIFLDGAHWNTKRRYLEKCTFKELYRSMPLVWFRPDEKMNIVTRHGYQKKRNIELQYVCPTYRINKRRSAISSLGVSNNFIASVVLETLKHLLTGENMD